MFQVQVTGDWAGSVGGWRPAVDGTFNQTGLSAEEASTCDTQGDAEFLLDQCVQALKSHPEDGDPRDNAARFRIVVVSGL